MNVLVPMDGSDPARAALEHALDTYPDAEITVVHVIDIAMGSAYGGEIGFNYDAILDVQREEADQLLETARSIAADKGIEVTTETVMGRPSRGIVEFANEIDADHIVIGSHGRSGVSRILLGSVAERVTRRAPMNVTVVRPE